VLDTLTAVRALYVDLDGTLLGPGGALFRDEAGSFTLLGAKAVEACTRAGAEVVVTTGRRPAGAMEIARLLGQTSAIFEAGAGYMLDGETHWLTGDWQPTATHSIFEQIEDAGAPALLLEHFAGRLEPHAPWNVDREVSHLMRGLIDVDEANTLLTDNGFSTLRLLDNGAAHRRTAALEALPYLRVYHLLPAVASKASGVLAHARARGYTPGDCIAVGDSREDMDMAAHVGRFWLVANALAKDDSLSKGRPDNVRVTESTYGAGVYEAVVTTLATRGAPG
jgi:hydroxymethylpyrimidine pyrophosphatase-like HAD family hydrolase